ncbi:MAG: hypothetical protein ACYDB1_09520 [Acidiferrobacteraceae bacterium]
MAIVLLGLWRTQLTWHQHEREVQAPQFGEPHDAVVVAPPLRHDDGV